MKTLGFSIILAVLLFVYVKANAAVYHPPFNMVAVSSKQVDDTYKRIREDMEDKMRTPPAEKDDKRKEEDHKRDKKRPGRGDKE